MIVYVGELRDDVNAKFERRWEASKDFKISCKKMEYINWNFNRDVQRDVTPLRIEAQEIPQNFNPNRRSIISEDGEIKDDAKHRIRAKRLK